MSEIAANVNQSRAARAGWILLLFVTISNVVGHIGLLLFDNPDTVFLAWATMNLLAAAIVAVPYRRGERWAWTILWALVIPYAAIILFNAEIGPIYLGEAALLVLGQLLAARHFSTERPGK